MILDCRTATRLAFSRTLAAKGTGPGKDLASGQALNPWPHSGMSPAGHIDCCIVGNMRTRFSLHRVSIRQRFSHRFGVFARLRALTLQRLLSRVFTARTASPT